MLFALPRELTYEQNLALVRDYCQMEFVDKGMVCNFFYHDKGDGNPQVHIMLTLRAMDENGKWISKSRNGYALNENGNHIRYGARRVIPDALSRVSEERGSIKDLMETAGNQKGPEQIENEAAQTDACWMSEQKKVQEKRQGRNSEGVF